MTEIKDKARRTGKTTRGIMSLPSGGTYVVHACSFIDYCQKIRADITYKVFNPRDPEQFRGFSNLAFDHYLYEIGLVSLYGGDKP